MGRPPYQISDFIGQKQALKSVWRRQDGAKARGEPLPPHLFAGASGLGKSLAASVLGERAGTKVLKFTCNETPEQIVETLRRIEPCDVGFLDECHRLRREAQEIFYEVIDHQVVPGGLVRSITEPVAVAPFSLVFATDKPGELEKALRRRIPALVIFQPYPENEMKEIVQRIAARNGILLSASAARQIARICNGIPRRAEHRVNDVRLFHPNSESKLIGKPEVDEYLRVQGIDADGLGACEHQYLDFLAKNKRASLSALAAHIGVDAAFVETQIEQPFRYLGLITTTSTGRILTQNGKELVRNHAHTKQQNHEETTVEIEN